MRVFCGNCDYRRTITNSIWRRIQMRTAGLEAVGFRYH